MPTIPGTVVPSNALITPGGPMGPTGPASTVPGPVGPGASPQEVGTIKYWPVATPPQYWLNCDGSAVSRTAYATLFALIGTTFGNGDNLTTFNLPDLRGRVALGVGQGSGLTNRLLAAIGGEENHTLSIAELAAHNHTATQGTHTHTDSGHVHYCSGVDHLHATPNVNHTHGMDHYHNIDFSQINHGHSIGAINYANVNAGTSATIYQYLFGSANGSPYVNATATAAFGTGSSGWASAVGYTNTAGNTTIASTSGACDRSVAFNSNSAAAVISTVSAGAISVANTGSGTGHNTMPPFLVINFIIKVTLEVPLNNPVAPIADPTTAGLVNQLSGNSTDYIGGDNQCYPIAGATNATIWAVRMRSFNALGNSTFEVDQRNQGASVSYPAGSNTQFQLDRWQVGKAAATAVLSGQQVSTGAGALWPGTNYRISSKYLTIGLTTPQATLAASEYIQIIQFIEGSNLRELINDVHSLSLLVSCTQAFTFSLTLGTPATAYTLTKLCQITTPGAWTLFQFPALPVFPTASGVTILPGAYGYYLRIGLGAGTTYTSPSNDVWNAGTFVCGPGSTNFASLPAGTSFTVLFVQHEPGQYCSAPIDLPFTENLDACQRYYSKAVPYGVNFPSAGYYYNMGFFPASATYVRCSVTFPKRMAKTPTVTSVGTTATTGQIYLDNGGGNVAVSTYNVWDTGLWQMALSAAGPATAAAAIGTWQADTGW